MGDDDSNTRKLDNKSSGPSGGSERQPTESRQGRQQGQGRSGSEADQKRPLERLADEHDWEFLSAGESPADAGSEIRGNIEDRSMRLFRDADGGSLIVQMPVDGFQGAIGFQRDPEAPDPSQGGGAQRDQGAAKPDWASDGANDNFVTPDIEAYTSQSRTLFENMPEDLKQKLLKIMRRNGVMNLVITKDRAETTALEIPGTSVGGSGASPVEAAGEFIDVTHRLISLAEAGEAGSIGPGEQQMGAGMTEGQVFHKVTCEYCQTEFQAVNRHKCPNCGAPVQGE